MKTKIMFLYALGVCWIAAGIGSIATLSQIPTWYTTLIKPMWNPPNWLFGPAWTVLYTLMAISLYLLWTHKNKDKAKAINFFYIQLALNVLWSWIFFGWHRLDYALVEIVILWIAILATIISTYKVSRIGGWLLIPYIMWVTFAGYLNYTIWMLNR